MKFLHEQLFASTYYTASLSYKKFAIFPKPSPFPLSVSQHRNLLDSILVIQKSKQCISIRIELFI